MIDCRIKFLGIGLLSVSLVFLFFSAVKAEEGSGEMFIQPGDRLKIKIDPEDDYIKGGEVPVSAEGNITLPLIGKVDVAGKLTAQAEQIIGEIVDADYLVNPKVVIEVLKRAE